MAERKVNSKNDSESKPESKRPEFVRFEGESLPVFYANNVNSQMSVWDLRFDFGQIEDVKDGKILVRPLVRVILSPQHAKAFAALLERQIKNYEQQFGTIPTASIEISEG